MIFIFTETGESTETLQNLISDGLDPAESIDVLEHVKKKSQFDNFWAAVDDLLIEVAVPDERRHRTTNVLAPAFVSLSHFREEAQVRMSQLFPDNSGNHVPSLEFFR